MVVTLLKNRYIIVFTVIICIISLTFTSCMYGTYVLHQHLDEFTANETIWEDETGKYQIKFHKIPGEYAELRGGSWYEKSTNTELFKFQESVPVGSMHVIVDDTEIGYISWTCKKKGKITICHFFDFKKYDDDVHIDENFKFLFNQEFVFKEVSK